MFLILVYVLLPNARIFQRNMFRMKPPMNRAISHGMENCQVSVEKENMSGEVKGEK